MIIYIQSSIQEQLYRIPDTSYFTKVMNTIPKEEAIRFSNDFYDMTTLPPAYKELFLKYKAHDKDKISFIDLPADLQSKYVMFKLSKLPSFPKIRSRVVEECIAIYPDYKNDIVSGKRPSLPFVKTYPRITEEICNFVQKNATQLSERQLIGKKKIGDYREINFRNLLLCLKTDEIKQFFQSFYSFDGLSYQLALKWRDLIEMPGYTNDKSLFLLLSEEDRKTFVAYKLHVLLADHDEGWHSLHQMSEREISDQYFYHMVQLEDTLNYLFSCLGLDQYRSLSQDERYCLWGLATASKQMGIECDLAMYQKELSSPIIKSSEQDKDTYKQMIRVIKKLNDNLFAVRIRPIMMAYVSNHSDYSEILRIVDMSLSSNEWNPENIV